MYLFQLKYHYESCRCQESEYLIYQYQFQLKDSIKIGLSTSASSNFDILGGQETGFSPSLFRLIF